MKCAILQVETLVNTISRAGLTRFVGARLKQNRIHLAHDKLSINHYTKNSSCCRGEDGK
ncbi:hypothetical protein ACNR9V_14570 [Parageobacillus thermoglucosidasius]|uniref:hypothetical protein n=1 Tax=Parageobacillus thermoglucosidasius TaxID=1426 RepID=UPI0012FDA2DE